MKSIDKLIIYTNNTSPNRHFYITITYIKLKAIKKLDKTQQNVKVFVDFLQISQKSEEIASTDFCSFWRLENKTLKILSQKICKSLFSWKQQHKGCGRISIRIGLAQKKCHLCKNMSFRRKTKQSFIKITRRVLIEV